jgi:hypothetical protein
MINYKNCCPHRFDSASESVNHYTFSREISVSTHLCLHKESARRIYKEGPHNRFSEKDKMAAVQNSGPTKMAARTEGIADYSEVIADESNEIADERNGRS